MTHSRPRFCGAVFDLDGTLIDTEPLHLDAQTRALEELGINPSDSRRPRTFGMGIERGVQALASAFELDHHVLLATYVRFWEPNLENGVTFMPGAGEVLDWLRHLNIPMALVTSGARRYVSLIDIRRAGQTAHPHAFAEIAGDLAHEIGHGFVSPGRNSDQEEGVLANAGQQVRGALGHPAAHVGDISNPGFADWAAKQSEKYNTGTRNIPYTADTDTFRMLHGYFRAAPLNPIQMGIYAAIQGWGATDRAALE